MNAPAGPRRFDDARFAALIGVKVTDIDAVERAFSAIMAKNGVDGKQIFQALRRGESFGAALSVPPKSIPLLYARAHSWFSVGRIDKAGLLFRALCAIAGGVADHWVGYGVCLKKEKRFAEAEQAFLKGAARRPDWAVPHFHLMETYMRIGDRARASAAFDAFEARIADDTPDGLLTEARRYRAVLAAQADAADLRAAAKE